MKIIINKKSDNKILLSELSQKIKPGKFYKRQYGDIRYYFLANENAGIMEIFSPLEFEEEDDCEPSIIYRPYIWFDGYKNNIFVEEVDCQLELIITEL